MDVKKMKVVIQEAGIEIADTVTDRTHRIGKGNTDTKIKKKSKRS